MSKISDFLEARRQEQEAKFVSVEDFAKSLNNSTQELVEQLRKAGVEKSLPSDEMTAEDQQKFLNYLCGSQQGSQKRKKITVTLESTETKFLKRVATGENGADRELLEKVAGQVIWGGDVDALTQKVFNLLVAKAVVLGALPVKKRGRPKSEELANLGYQISARYWDIRDSGMGYQEAVTALAESFHKNERHIMRLVEKYKTEIGETFEIRKKKRDGEKVMREMYLHHPNMFASYRSFFSSESPAPELNVEDYLDHLEEEIAKTAAQAKLLTLNI